MVAVPFDVIGSTPSSPALVSYLQSLAAQPGEALPEPDVKSFSNSVYYSYFTLGISLNFTPVNGYKPKPNEKRINLLEDNLRLESIDVYNSGLASANQLTSNRKLANPEYSPYPALPITLRSSADIPNATWDVSTGTTGKEFVSNLGEPSRKGGGTGPSGGSIGIWCEWGKAGLMVEFGGDESKGTQAWERGKDAIWSVMTFFAPES